MDIGSSLTEWHPPPNKSLQGSVTHKVLGRGRSGSVLDQVVRARVLNRSRAAPELNR